ncbi:hypothetical protein HYT02_05175 [Candidatus Gottesmanbacteria bacterium]|nr:hypothetical protein [Candidatus Gottesmanbacteria bacterium]
MNKGERELSSISNAVFNALNLNLLRKQYPGYDEQGIRSITSVYYTLLGLPYVDQIDVIPPNSSMDHSGIDLEVYLQKGFFTYTTDFVGVQVKSTQHEMNRFRRVRRNKLGLTPDELEKWLLWQKIIVLNGQQDRTEIENKFFNKLAEINKFHNPYNPKRSKFLIDFIE